MHIADTLFDIKWGVGKLQNPFDFSTIIHILKPGYFVRMVGRIKTMWVWVNYYLALHQKFV